MQNGSDLENVLVRPFYGPLATLLGPGHVARLREVSRGVKAHVDQMRRGRIIKLNEPWFAALPGTPAQNLAELMGRLTTLLATGAVIRELILPRVELDGTEPALLLLRLATAPVTPSSSSAARIAPSPPPARRPGPAT